MPSPGASPLELRSRFSSVVNSRPQQDIRTAEQKAAAASYTAIALRAFEDVENALASDYYLRQTRRRADRGGLE